MKKVMIQAGTDSGCVFYASLELSDDWTMIELANAVRNHGWDYFRICDTMSRFARV